MLQSRAIFALGCLVFSAAAGTLLGACGGDGGSKQPAESAHDVESTSQARADSDEPSDTPAEADEASEASPRRTSCDDGTCAPCGDGICPSGWYCDEGAKGGPACGWLPECAQKPSCACLTRALSGCSCEEKQGGLHLSCG
jgi:hypothetical protein